MEMSCFFSVDYNKLFYSTPGARHFNIAPPTPYRFPFPRRFSVALSRVDGDENERSFVEYESFFFYFFYYRLFSTDDVFVLYKENVARREARANCLEIRIGQNVILLLIVSDDYNVTANPITDYFL